MDRRRIAYVGDTFAGGPAGPRFGGPVFQNRFKPGDFVESVTKIRDFEPEFILTGHWGAQRVERTFLDAALSEASAIEGIIWGLIAVPEEAGFALDPNWATLYPYQATAVPGEPVELTLRIVNHLSTPTTARAELRLPAGWKSESSMPSVEIAGGDQGEIRFRVSIPTTAAPGERHVVAASIALGDRRFGPLDEGIVQVQSAGGEVITRKHASSEPTAS